MPHRATIAALLLFLSSASAQAQFPGCPTTGVWRSYPQFPSIVTGLMFGAETGGQAEICGVVAEGAALVCGFTSQRVGAAITSNASFEATMIDCDTIIDGNGYPHVRVRSSYCGDGTVDPGEVCDDGNFNPLDACGGFCRLPTCQDGDLDPGEVCDDGPGGTCNDWCAAQTCGNGTIEPGEDCDDGNLVDGDGCSATCVVQRCGNTVVEAGEACDDGNDVDADGCNTVCQVQVCGNGITEAPEECDDGNLRNWDACTTVCQARVTGDVEGDGIGEDGDGDGTAGALPCTGGATTDCDDNCPWNFNPLQEDGDGDGVGDLCDWNCRSNTGSAIIGGTVYREAIGPDSFLSYAPLWISGTNCWEETVAGPTGSYAFANLKPDTYRIESYPPAGYDDLLPEISSPVTVAGSDVRIENLVLALRIPRPPGMWVFGSGMNVSGCPGGTGTFAASDEQGTPISSGVLTETPVGSGSYGADASFIPATWGPVHISTEITCPDTTVETTESFDYIDPSGTVTFVSGTAAAGSTVTLLRSDTPAGPFEVVPDGSAIMSPTNRRNPDVAKPDGRFGWDVIAGYYVVRAENADCTTESAVLTIPPPVTDLALVLQCSGCPPVPASSCRVGAATLKMKRGATSALSFTWKKGPDTPLATFGDPTTATSYGVCLYGGDGLLFDATALGGETCGTVPCWKATGTKGFSYKSRDGASDGLTGILLKAGTAGKPVVKVKGKGAGLVLPGMPLTAPLRMQVQSSAGPCFEAEFTSLKASSDTTLSAKTD